MRASDIHATLRNRPRLWPALTLALSAAMLAVAWGFQLLGGLHPCALCLHQRWPYWIAIGLAALAVPAARQIGMRGLAAFAGAGALVFLAGAGIAGFHVGVEQRWWQGLSSCGAAPLDDPNMSIAELRNRLLAAAPVRCDEAPWSLLGISLAGYNFLASLLLAAASAWAARGFWRNPA